MVVSNFKRQIPNILTIARIILVLPIIVILLVPHELSAYTFKIDNTTMTIYWNEVVAAILFIIASISDFLDGYLSRKFNWISDFGKFWDPLADKILVNSVFILLAINNLTHIGFVLVFIIRDIFVDGIRMYSAKKDIVVAASKFGKWKTCFQMFAIIILLFVGSIKNDVIWWYWGVLNLFVYFSVLVSIISGIDYGIMFMKQCKQNRSFK